MKENRFNEENPKPGYYAILTAAVRYDTNLLASEKLLFAEITALCNEKGYCYASNSYFADLYNTTVRTVSAWVSSLGKAGHITYVIDVENGNKRKIYLTGKMPDIQHQKIKKVKKEKKQISIGIEADFHRVTKQTSIGIEADFNTSNSISNSISNNTYTLAPEKNEIKKTISHIDKPLPKTDIDLKNKILIFLNDENDISQEARRAIFEKIQRRQIKIPGGLTLNETLAELVDWWATRRFAKNLDLNINYAAFVAAFKADLDYYNSVQPDEKKYKKDNPIKTTGHIIRTQYDENGVPIPRNKNVTI